MTGCVTSEMKSIRELPNVTDLLLVASGHAPPLMLVEKPAFKIGPNLRIE